MGKQIIPEAPFSSVRSETGLFLEQGLRGWAVLRPVLHIDGGRVSQTAEVSLAVRTDRSDSENDFYQRGRLCPVVKHKIGKKATVDNTRV